MESSKMSFEVKLEFNGEIVREIVTTAVYQTGNTAQKIGNCLKALGYPKRTRFKYRALNLCHSCGMQSCDCEFTTK